MSLISSLEGPEEFQEAQELDKISELKDIISGILSGLLILRLPVIRVRLPIPHL